MTLSPKNRVRVIDVSMVMGIFVQLLYTATLGEKSSVRRITEFFNKTSALPFNSSGNFTLRRSQILDRMKF